jgi:hypothetical protein
MCMDQWWNDTDMWKPGVLGQKLVKNERDFVDVILLYEIPFLKLKLLKGTTRSAVANNFGVSRYPDDKQG